MYRIPLSVSAICLRALFTFF
uniref:Uncharacterized protein n=1 Tax=Rhizophora mucronata TaxID=61149 RepID=A0A2P2NZU3_RHIMU